MSEEEIKSALSIEFETCSNMGGEWDEIRLLWNDEVISTDKSDFRSHYDD